MVLPGGRYSCAQVLVQRRLPFLVGRSLGQVCHIVQLAISQKKLLGYLNGTVVPYSRSQSMVKEQSAECQRPCSGAARHKSAVASWDLMRQCLQQLMDNMGPGEHSLPLSNIKRLFRAQFHIELSETALGYAKLSECLQDPRLHDLCEVKLKGHGYGIVPIKKPTFRSRISLSDSLGMEPRCPPPVHVADVGGECSEPLRSGCMQRLGMDDMLSPDPSSKVASPLPSKVSAFHNTPTPTRIIFPPTPSPSPACNSSHAYGTRRVLSMATLAPARLSMSPSPTKAQVHYGRPLPRLLGNLRTRPQGLAGAAIKEALAADSSPSQKKAITGPTFGSPAAGSYKLPPGASGACTTTPNEPTVMQTPQKKNPSDSSQWGFTPMSPGTFGFSVHNTFLHAALPLPTPVRAGARFRARSMDAC